MNSNNNETAEGASLSNEKLEAGKAGLLGVAFLVLGSFVGAWWWGIAIDHPGPVLAWFALGFAFAATDGG